MAGERIPDGPGLVVYAPPGKPWWSTACPSASAAYRCLCGATGTSAGEAGVLALLDEWEKHVGCSPHRTVLAALSRSRRGAT